MISNFYFIRCDYFSYYINKLVFISNLQLVASHVHHNKTVFNYYRKQFLYILFLFVRCEIAN